MYFAFRWRDWLTQTKAWNELVKVVVRNSVTSVTRHRRGDVEQTNSILSGGAEIPEICRRHVQNTRPSAKRKAPIPNVVRARDIQKVGPPMELSEDYGLQEIRSLNHNQIHILSTASPAAPMALVGKPCVPSTTTNPHPAHCFPSGLRYCPSCKGRCGGRWSDFPAIAICDIPHDRQQR